MSALSRLDRLGQPLTALRANAIWHLCHEEGVVVARASTTTLAVSGPRPALDRLVPLLMRHKAALLRGLCSLCVHNLAEESGYCRWCENVRGRRHRYEPGSEAERQFLSWLEPTSRAAVANSA